jgi:hypothetical protein
MTEPLTSGPSIKAVITLEAGVCVNRAADERGTVLAVDGGRCFAGGVERCERAPEASSREPAALGPALASFVSAQPKGSAARRAGSALGGASFSGLVVRVVVEAAGVLPSARASRPSLPASDDVSPGGEQPRVPWKAQGSSDGRDVSSVGLCAPPACAVAQNGPVHSMPAAALAQPSLTTAGSLPARRLDGVSVGCAAVLAGLHEPLKSAPCAALPSLDSALKLVPRDSLT